MADIIEFKRKTVEPVKSKVLVDDDVTFFVNLYFKHMNMYYKVKKMRFCLFKSFILSRINKLIDDDKSYIVDACRCLCW